MKTGMAKVNGTTLYYEVKGKGHPLVFISGGGTLDSRMWDEQFDFFAERYQVICYDIRGLGKSGKTESPFSHSQDLYALLKHLGIRKAHIAGVSFAGAIAIDFALEHPNMAASLILASTGTSSDSKSEANLQSVLALAAMAKREGLEKTIQTIIDLPFFISKENFQAREKMRRVYFDNRHVFENEFPLIRFWQPAQPPAAERLSEIRVPALIIMGDQDHLSFKAITDNLHAGISGSKKVVIPGGAHIINMDRPKEFNQAVLDFLNRV